ncbi:MAG: hypothetical protein H0V73_12175, partial [Chloroflexi bacterium]|nr:hypothetical protein [Chloroflexota bacterium]
RRQRAYALLARNGFDPETCRTAAGELLAAKAAEDEDGDEGAWDGGAAEDGANGQGATAGRVETEG